MPQMKKEDVRISDSVIIIEINEFFSSILVYSIIDGVDFTITKIVINTTYIAFKIDSTCSRDQSTPDRWCRRFNIITE